MRKGFIIIAGQTEGFQYKDGYIVNVLSYEDIEPTIKELLEKGYKIFIVTEIIGSVDTIANKAVTE